MATNLKMPTKNKLSGIKGDALNLVGSDCCCVLHAAKKADNNKKKWYRFFANMF